MQDTRVRLALTTLPRSDEGFTLVEVLVAMVITLVALMGLLQSVQIVNETNLRNQMRDEAVRLGGKQMNELMSASYGADTPQDMFANYSVRSSLRGLTNKYYIHTERNRMNAPASPGTPPATSKIALVTVHWRFKTFSTTLLMSSIKSQ